MDPGISSEFLKLAGVNSGTEIKLDNDIFHFFLFCHFCYIVDTYNQLCKSQKDTDLCKKSAFAVGILKI